MNIEFKLKDKVSCSKGGRFNSPGGKGEVRGILLEAYNDTGVFLQVRHTNNSVYNYELNQVKLLKTQKLYSYVDLASEVHWSTRVYSETELKQFGFRREEKFDKSIDLE